VRRVSKIETTKTFDNDYRRLPEEIKAKLKDRLKKFSETTLDKIPAGFRFEKLKGYKNPSIHTIHITGNHSYKLSFVLRDTEDGTIMTLRRVGSHGDIDRSP